MDFKTRFAHLEELAEHYQDFREFAEDGMQFLGFTLTEVQADIAEFMQLGPRLRMVMAQRGQAKTTIAALYAVWRIVQRPSTRVLIVSAGEQNSSETATLIVRIIMTWDVLEALRPDRTAGDRTSTNAFDVHYSLKGLDRSPSVACAGITSNLPGRRADLLIADDIESNKNGLTAVQRGQLLHLSKEFSSICTHGDILYLGTPQSKDSIYNTLQGRGFCIRIWPGRYPTLEEEERYTGRLAPLLQMRVQADAKLRKGGGLDGTRGQPTDPGRYTDADLVEKELDKGPEDFQLQYMLDTSLADAARQQLKLSDLVVANFGADALPEVIAWQASPKYEVDLKDFVVPTTKMYYALPVECAFVKPTDVVMFIDPAGGGSDEIGVAVSTAVGPYIHVLDVGGLKGGLVDANGEAICDIAVRNGVTRVRVESNMGHGLFEITLRSIFAKREDTRHLADAVTGEYSTGQKEKRIIDSLVAPMQRHRVVVHQQVFDSDAQYCKQHSADARVSYSLWYQMSNITTDRDSLVHDDRLEAVAGAVRMFKHVLVQDEHKAAEARARANHAEFMRNPMGYTDSGVQTTVARGTRARIGNRRRR